MKLLLDGRTAIADLEAFQSLPEYNTSLPTGTAIGKRWKRRAFRENSWILGEYAECNPPSPDDVRIKWRRLYVV